MNIKQGEMQMLGSFILGHASGAEQVHMEVHTQLHKHLLIVPCILILLGKEAELSELVLFTYKRFICCVNRAVECERLPTGRWLRAVDKFTFLFNPCYFVMPGSIFHVFFSLFIVWTLISYALLCSRAHIINTSSPFRLSPHFVKPLEREGARNEHISKRICNGMNEKAAA